MGGSRTGSPACPAQFPVLGTPVFAFRFWRFPLPACNEAELHRRVAAVCYRRTAADPEFLLVRTWDGEWTFPKGMIDPGHTESEAAEVEAWEEAGVEGVVEREPFTTYSADKELRSGELIRVEVTAFLLEVRKTQPPPESHRRPQWFSPAAAKQALAEGRSGRRAQELARVVALAVQKITI